MVETFYAKISKKTFKRKVIFWLFFWYFDFFLMIFQAETSSKKKNQISQKKPNIISYILTFFVQNYPIRGGKNLEKPWKMTFVFFIFFKICDFIFLGRYSIVNLIEKNENDETFTTVKCLFLQKYNEFTKLLTLHQGIRLFDYF